MAYEDVEIGLNTRRTFYLDLKNPFQEQYILKTFQEANTYESFKYKRMKLMSNHKNGNV